MPVWTDDCQTITTKDTKSTKIEIGAPGRCVTGCAIEVHRFLGPGELITDFDNSRLKVGFK